MARTRTGPTPAELALLGLLAEGPAHPYSLDAKLRENGAPTDVAFSSIYAALDRLERLGLVKSRPDAGSRGKARRVYRLSPQGRGELKDAARTALSRPLIGPRPNELGVANLTLMTRQDALEAIADARRSLADERRNRPSTEGPYPHGAVLLHRAMLAAAEERFYAELERMVQRAHPERHRRRSENEEEAEVE